MKKRGKRKSESTTMNWGGERKSEKRRRRTTKRRANWLGFFFNKLTLLPLVTWRAHVFSF